MARCRGGASALATATSRSEADATRDGGAGVDPVQRPRRTGGELGCEQRKMGAGEDDGVDALAAELAEQTGERALDGGWSDGFAAQLLFRQFDEFGGAVPQPVHRARTRR